MIMAEPKEVNPYNTILKTESESGVNNAIMPLINKVKAPNRIIWKPILVLLAKTSLRCISESLEIAFSVFSITLK